MSLYGGSYYFHFLHLGEKPILTQSLRPQRATCAAFGLPATEEVLRRVTLLQHAEGAAEKGLKQLEA